MTTEQGITKFNEENRPFYIVDLESGRYSLCLPLDLLGDEFYPYCQNAFDAYAREIGDEPLTEHGLRTHGDGYEWQAAFCQAFDGDPNLKRFVFDCEAGGFFMDCDDLSLLEEYGKRFKAICEDEEAFTPIVSAGIKRQEMWFEEQEKMMKTVRGWLLENPSCTFDIMSPYGNVSITPDETKRLLDGVQHTVKIDGAEYAAYELLDQEVIGSQVDLFDSSIVRLKTEEPDLDMYEQTL